MSISSARVIGAAGAVVLLIWGCRPGEGPEVVDQGVVMRDSLGIQIIESEGPSWITSWVVGEEPVLRIGVGHGPEEYTLHRVTSVIRLSDGRFVVANDGSGELRWYDPSGEFLSRAGRRGQGPGEFLSLSELIQLPGDSLAVSDVRLARLSVLDSEGELVRTVRVEGEFGRPIPVARFRDQTYLSVSPVAFALRAEGPPRVERLSIDVALLSEEDGVAEPLMNLPGIEVEIAPTGTTLDGVELIGRMPRTLGRNTAVAADAQGWVVGDNDRAELQYRDPAGDLIRIARWQMEPRLVTPNDVARVREIRLEAASTPATRAALDEHPELPETMPAFDAKILFDTEGNTWVKAFAPFFEDDPNRFLVFDSDGIWLGFVEAPVGTEIMAIGDDWVAGVSRDAFGVETVVVHELQKP